MIISISRVARFGRYNGSAAQAQFPTQIYPNSLKEKQSYKQVSAKSRTKRASIAHSLRKLTTNTVLHIKQRPRLLAHVGLSLAVIMVVLAGSLKAAESNQTTKAIQVGGTADTLVEQSGYGGLVDETANAYIAANVAQHIELPLADQVVKDAQALTSQASYAATSDLYLSKPQLLNTGGIARGIQHYTVVAGDTVDSIAQKFNITSNTIRWANDLENGEPIPGQVLIILPVSGVLHTVSDTDTAQGLALIYQADAAQIIAFNDAEVSGLKPGSQIIIPGGQIVATTAPTLANIRSFRPTFSGNGYDYGWCTWHVANRRAASGRPIPSNWGNASAWKYNAAASGYSIGSIPVPGAIVYHNNIGGLGHVAYVERVENGGAVFSDMNYPLWGQVTERFVPASDFSNYSFIY